MVTGERGHRLADHTADVAIEAWGPDLASCLEEAVTALVETYAEGHEAARPVGERHVHLPPAATGDLLVDLLEEVIFTLDTAARGVPVRAIVQVAPDGGLDAVLVLAEGVTGTGSAPKAVSRSELSLDRGSVGFRCRVIVDV
jgi:SHS2 domain-containing protein